MLNSNAIWIDHYHQSNTFRTRATAFNSNPGEVGLSETEPPIAPRRRSPEELYANALTEYESIEPAPNTGYSSAERTESDYANSRPVEYQRHDQRIPYSYGPGPGEYPPPPPAPYYRHSGAPGRAAPPDSVGLTAPRAYQYNYDAPQPMARPHDPAGGSNPSYHQPAPYGGGYGAPAPPPTTDHPPVQYYPYSDGYFRRPE